MFETSLGPLRNPQSRRSATLLLAVLISLVLIFAATAVDVSAVLASSSEPAAAAPAPRTWAPHEIPREWTWQRDPIRFDHMFREGGQGSSGSVDWIRQSRAH